MSVQLEGSINMYVHPELASRSTILSLKSGSKVDLK